ncbi:MAG: Spy/CpxP family protein refolding chaperone [Myxococcota bacterium]
MRLEPTLGRCPPTDLRFGGQAPELLKPRRLCPEVKPRLLRQAREVRMFRHHHHHHHHGEGRCGGWRGARRRRAEAHEEGARMHGDLLFGVRRPLRFMAHKLDLDEDQIETLARILGDLKTERSQASVDRERSVARLADALDAEDFNAEAVEAALALRVESASKLKDAVLAALRASHDMLRPEQRKRLAYLLRSGALTI